MGVGLEQGSRGQSAARPDACGWPPPTPPLLCLCCRMHLKYVVAPVNIRPLHPLDQRHVTERHCRAGLGRRVCKAERQRGTQLRARDARTCTSCLSAWMGQRGLQLTFPDGERSPLGVEGHVSLGPLLSPGRLMLVPLVEPPLRRRQALSHGRRARGGGVRVEKQPAHVNPVLRRLQYCERCRPSQKNFTNLPRTTLGTGLARTGTNTKEFKQHNSLSQQTGSTHTGVTKEFYK